MMTDQIRCANPLCNKRLFDVEDLVINPEGSITVKCKCKKKNKLTSTGLTVIDE